MALGKRSCWGTSRRACRYVLTASSDCASNGESGSTAQSVAAFQKALAEAKAVMADTDATQEKVNAAWDNLLEGIWQEVAQWLDDRTADIGFLSYQEDMPYDWIPLAEDPMLALLPKDHPLARAKAYPLANCAVDRFIMPAKGCDDDLMALFHRTGIVPNVQFTTLESLSAMSMVEQGLGMSVMNKLITERRVCDIVMLPVDPPASITLGIALHSKADLSPAVRMFLKYAVRMLTRQKKA